MTSSICPQCQRAVADTIRHAHWHASVETELRQALDDLWGLSDPDTLAQLSDTSRTTATHNHNQLWHTTGDAHD